MLSQNKMQNMKLFKTGTIVDIIIPGYKQTKTLQPIVGGSGKVSANKNQFKESFRSRAYVAVTLTYLPNADKDKLKQLMGITIPVRRDWLVAVYKFCACDFKSGNWACICGLGRKEINGEI